MPEEKQSNSVDNNENISMNNNVSNNKNQDKSGSFSGVETISPVSKYRKNIYHAGLDELNKESGNNNPYDGIELDEKIKINATEKESSKSNTNIEKNPKDDNSSENLEVNQNKINQTKKEDNYRPTKHVAKRKSNNNSSSNVKPKNENQIPNNNREQKETISSNEPVNNADNDESLNVNPYNDYKEDYQQNHSRTNNRNNNINSEDSLADNLKKKRNQAVNWINSFGRPVNEPDEKTNEDSSNNDEAGNEPKVEDKEKSNTSENQNNIGKNNVKKSESSAGSFAAKSDKIISHVAKYWKFYLLGGGIVLLVLFLLILTTLLSVGEEILSSSQDFSSGYVARTNPGSSYQCVDSDSSESSEAGDMSALYTPLSKSEFVRLLREYNYEGTAGQKAAFNVLKENAELIYDVAMEMGVNPELAVLRGMSEGFSPYSKGYQSKNNLWGYGCYNGEDLSTCTTFSSFEDGLRRGIFRYIVNNKNGMSSVGIETDKYSIIFGRYAQLHSGNWGHADGYRIIDGKPDYSNCNWGLSECCRDREVIKYLKIMGENERAEQIRQACQVTFVPIQILIKCDKFEDWNSSDNLDQRAYAWYRTEEIVRDRAKVFKIESDGTATAPSNCQEKIITDDISDVVDNVNLVKLEGEAYATLLKNSGTSIDNINQQLLLKITQSGVGTRKAVVNAAKFQLNAFATFGKKITYLYTGGHSEFYDKSGKQIGKASDEFYGINPYYGVEVSKPTSFENGTPEYKYLGLDCSGSAIWALHNAGVNLQRATSEAYYTRPGDFNITLSDVFDFSKPAQPGDLIVKYGDFVGNDGKKRTEHHTALIAEVEYSGDDPHFIIIEETDSGLIAKKRSLKSDGGDANYLKKFKVAHLDYYYDNPTHYDNFEQTFKDGLIKWEG